MDRATKQNLNIIFEYGFTLQSLGIISGDEDIQLYSDAVDRGDKIWL
jgi:hypothetical protein